MSELITESGVFDIPAETYPLDPVAGGSLSSSGARRLMGTCPAKFRYEREHPVIPTADMNFGTAAHRVVLGAGNDLVRINADSYRSKAAQAARDEIREAGGTPLLPAEWDTVHEMAAALRAHPVASALLGGEGAAEHASGFLLKRARPEEIVQGIRTVCRGDSLLFPAAIRNLAAAHRGEPPAPHAWHDHLTEREGDVLRLMAKGLTNAEIGEELFVSLQTVKTHVGNVLAKLHARDRTQAVIFAYESGFITPG